jgi:hypothetical protein
MASSRDKSWNFSSSIVPVTLSNPTNSIPVFLAISSNTSLALTPFSIAETFPALYSIDMPRGIAASREK